MDERLLRVQVKTCIAFRNNRWPVAVCTRGGNRSWSGLVKRFDATKCDYLFAVVGDGRRWCIPSTALEGGTRIVLGGPKYAEFEVEPGHPLPAQTSEKSPLQSTPSTLGGMSEWLKERGCKPRGTAYAGSNPAPPTPAD